MSSAFPTSTSKTSPARLVASETLKLPRWALFALCLLYILPGLVGRDPWKSEDATTFGVMWTMANGAAQGPHAGGMADWLLPNVAGAPVVEAGPLMYWVGAASIRAFGGLVSADLAARFATILFFFMAVTGVWYATYLVGRRPAAQPVTLAFGGQPEPQAYGRVLADGALLILLATVGLVIRAHESSSDVAMLAMFGVALYGMARSLDAPLRGAPWIAAGFVGLALSRGPAPAIALLLMWIALLTFSAEFRGARRAGLVVVLPLTLVGLAIWPVLALIALPDAAVHLAARGAHWRAYFDGIDAQALNKYVRTLPWTSWIAWPLAAWCVWTWRRRLGAAHIVLPGSFVIAMITMLCTTSDTSDGQLLLVLPGLVMLAACGLPTLRRGAANAFDWFSLLLYSIAAIFVWFSYFTRMTGVPAGFARSIDRLTPGASPEFRPVVFAIALAATVAWIVVVYWRISTNPRVLWRSVVLASGGLILTWTLVSTLFLYSINYSRTYRDVAAQVAQALTSAVETPRTRARNAPAPKAAPVCVATDGVGLAQRASFAWFAGVRFSQVDYAGANIDDCDFLLRQDQARNARGDTLPPGRWKLLWQGRRPADRDENFRLFRKTSSAGSTRGATDAVDRDAGRGMTAPIITAPTPIDDAAPTSTSPAPRAP